MLCGVNYEIVEMDSQGRYSRFCRIKEIMINPDLNRGLLGSILEDWVNILRFLWR